MKDEGLFIFEFKKLEIYYFIYEDSYGMYIFVNNDVNLMNELINLYDYYYCIWKFDGFYILGENFVVIVCLFVEVKVVFEVGIWLED